MGCCDPAQPWQWIIQQNKDTPFPRLGQAVFRDDITKYRPAPASQPKPSPLPTKSGVGASVSVYALFEGGLTGMEVYSLNYSTGEVLAKAAVHGLDDNPAGILLLLFFFFLIFFFGSRVFLCPS